MLKFKVIFGSKGFFKGAVSDLLITSSEPCGKVN